MKINQLPINQYNVIYLYHTFLFQVIINNTGNSLKHTEWNEPLRESDYWSYLNIKQDNLPVGMKTFTNGLSTPIDSNSLSDFCKLSLDTLGMPASDCLPLDFNAFPVDTNAQKHFLNNIKKLNQLSECSSGLLNPLTDLDPLFLPTNDLSDSVNLGLNQLFIPQDLPVPNLSSLPLLDSPENLSIGNSNKTNLFDTLSCLSTTEVESIQHENFSPSVSKSTNNALNTVLNGLNFVDNSPSQSIPVSSTVLSIKSQNNAALNSQKNISFNSHSNGKPLPYNTFRGSGLNKPFSLPLNQSSNDKLSPLPLKVEDSDATNLLQKLQFNQFPTHQPQLQMNQLSNQNLGMQQHYRNQNVSLNEERINLPHHQDPFLPTSFNSSEGILPIESCSSLTDMYSNRNQQHSFSQATHPRTEIPSFNDMSYPLLSLPPSLLGFRPLR